MDKLKGFVECLVPISQCNLLCSYCYVVQQKRRNNQTDSFRCTPEEIGKAFDKKRWGGKLLVSMCGYGETMLCKELPDIVYYVLQQGHYVNITNNGTINKGIEETLRKSHGWLHRLCFSFSLHYIELKKRGLLNTFANNVRKVREAGCSFLVQLNLSDEYIECIDEIKDYCLREFDAYPQVALTRRQGQGFQIFTDHTDEEYVNYGKSFQSPLFDMTYQNFKVKRNEFCYAGNWTYTLNLATGELRSCYFCRHAFYNIYDNIDEKVKKLTVGNNCRDSYCVNSSHFMSLGVIPEIRCPSYVDLRDRDGKWYTQQMRDFLSQKLYDNNKKYNKLQRIMLNRYFRHKESGKSLLRIYLSDIRNSYKNRFVH